jgi:hypothetical protein
VPGTVHGRAGYTADRDLQYVLCIFVLGLHKKVFYFTRINFSSCYGTLCLLFVPNWLIAFSNAAISV